MDRPSRARRRFHTDRIVANRRDRFIREFGLDWFYIGDVEHHNDKLDVWAEKRLEYGRLADRDPWDCGRRCFLCHFESIDRLPATSGLVDLLRQTEGFLGS